MYTKLLIVFAGILALMLSLTPYSPAQADEDRAGCLKFEAGQTMVYDIELWSYCHKRFRWEDSDGTIMKYRDWLLKMRWSMACVSINKKKAAEFEITIEVLKCEIKKKKEDLLIYDANNVDLTTSNDARALKAVQSLSGQKYTMTMNQSGQITSLKGMDQAAKASLLRAGRKSNAATELVTMGQVLLTDKTMYEVLMLIYRPCSHDILQRWEIPIVLQSAYFFYPWTLFPMEYEAAWHKKVGDAEYLQSKGRLNTSPVKNKGRTEALGCEDSVMGKATLLFDPVNARIKEHDFVIKIKHESSGRTLKEDIKFHIKFCHIK
ncbi:hypothetical protein ACFL54_09285 [Planctomycetota bacterium]